MEMDPTETKTTEEIIEYVERDSEKSEEYEIKDYIDQNDDGYYEYDPDEILALIMYDIE